MPGRPEVFPDIRFTMYQRMVLNAVHKAGPKGITLDRIRQLLYGTHAGPGDTVIREFIWLINKRIKARHKRIRCHGWNNRQPGYYVLEDHND